MENTQKEEISPITEATKPLSKDPQARWSVASHLLGFTYFLGIPGFIGPLIIYLILDENAYFAKRHAREALNFQINAFIWIGISSILCLILIGWLLLPVALLITFICSVLAAIKASDKEEYRYPFTYRFIK